ncbi:MAG: V-type ATP synthase subunit I, partial [Candidatus Competibacterales bacterium]
DPPTLLSNPEALAGGEQLATFYRVPGYGTWDPSAVLLGSFALFFAMILADAGYALVLLGGLLYAWQPLGHHEVGRRLRTLGLGVLLVATGYGVLAGSYFGLTPPTDSFLASLHLLDLDDFDAMMVLAVAVGALHVVLGHVISAWHAGPFPAWVPPVGWIVVMAGATALALGDEVLGWVGATAMGVGLLAVVAFASRRPVTSPKALALRVGEGLLALAQVTQLFGDVLSYLRLFALGLASASLAVTFNTLADQVRTEVPGLGLLLALLVLGLGHAINLALGLMSGLVHGLRLNYIEFFNWSLLREGHPFRAFARKERRP